MKFSRMFIAVLLTIVAGLVALPAFSQAEGGLKVPEGCGDKIIVAPEQCDDGNGIDGDGCNVFCQVEAPKPIFPTETYCGDAVVNTKGETCDDGNNLSDDGCDSNCQVEVKLIFPVEPECGNAILIKGEACDDGNSNSGDGCDSNCKIEVLPPAPLTVDETEPPTNTVSGIVVPDDRNDEANSNIPFRDSSQVGGGCSLVENSQSTSPWFSLMMTMLFAAGFYQMTARKLKRGSERK